MQRVADDVWQVACGDSILRVSGKDIMVEDLASTILSAAKPQKSDLHPTMKPVALVEKMVANSSPRGGLVFDPCGGSGTTLVACERLARRCNMMEYDPGYAAVNLDPTAQQENRALSDATVGRIEADADLKRYSAERQKLKLAKEQGLLMQRAEHEENLAARALFFKSEIESFGYRKAGEIIALVHGDDARLQELLAWWAYATADWMDAWAADHEFTTGDTDSDAQHSPQEPTEAE